MNLFPALQANGILPSADDTKEKLLLKSLDTLVYILLVHTYYYDPSFLRFMVRLCVQFHILSPRTINSSWPFNWILMVLVVSNLGIAVCHLIWPHSFIPEAAHGYLHGGIIIDFIGQTEPSCLRLVCNDLLIAFIQFLLLLVSQSGDQQDYNGAFGKAVVLDNSPQSNISFADLNSS